MLWVCFLVEGTDTETRNTSTAQQYPNYPPNQAAIALYCRIFYDPTSHGIQRPLVTTLCYQLFGSPWLITIFHSKARITASQSGSS